MKLRKFILLAILIAPALSFTGFAQENDDMYFSRKDRDKLSASISYTNHTSTNSNSEYASNHNFYSSTLQSTTAGSPTVQATGHEEADNNQYFIKDYSIKNKTDKEVKTYSGINTSNGYRSGVNVIFLFGSGYNSQFYGVGLYNPYNDPFSPYYDPFYRYRSPNSYASYRYDPWRYNRNYGYGYNNNYNAYSNSSNVCVNTSYSNNVRNEVKYRNGRKVISGTRSSRSSVRTTENSNRGRATINSDNNVSTNGRSSKSGNKNSYRKYKSNNQNRNTFNRSNNNINSSGWNRKSNSNSSTNFRSSGSSSGSRSSYSSGSRSSGSRSTGSSSRSSSGSSRSTKKRGN